MAVKHLKGEKAGQVEYAGCVLALRGGSWCIGSQTLYALCWDFAKSAPVNVTYHTNYTDYDSITVAEVEVDACAEAEAAFEDHERTEYLKELQARREREANTIAKGKTLRVVKGRKVPKGTVGFCFWCQQGDFGLRVGIKTAKDETFWTAASNCEVVRDEAAQVKAPPKPPQRTILIKGECIREVGKAYIFRMTLSRGKAEVCLPKSQVSIGDEGTVVVPEWLAKDKGLL